MNAIDIPAIPQHLMATGVLTFLVVQISPADYVSWMNTCDNAEFFIEIVRVLVTRFLTFTSDRPKNMGFMTNSKLMAPFLDFCISFNYRTFETTGESHERAARMRFYRAFISLAQVITHDCFYTFNAFEYPLEFVPIVYINEFESALIQYTTWIEVNARITTRYDIAGQIMLAYATERKRGNVDPLGLLPMYRTVLEHLWARPLTLEDFKLLEDIGASTKKGRAEKKTPAASPQK